MRHGFVKVAAMTPKIKVADVKNNADEIIILMKEADRRGAKVIVFPELCITGYTCNDLFLQETLLSGARRELLRIASCTKQIDGLVFVGLPFEKEGKLYNVAAVLARGEVLALIPKRYIPNYAEFYEMRHFTPGTSEVDDCIINGEPVPFGTNILFESNAVEGLMIGCELCEDVWAPNPPSTVHCQAGATLIVNLSASSETVGKGDYRRTLISATSARLVTGYVYCTAGEGESSQDLVFGGQNMIAENGTILAESERFGHHSVFSDIDIQRIRMERRRMDTYLPDVKTEYQVIPFAVTKADVILDRHFASMPFVPADNGERSRRCEEILSIQAYGLKKRLEHIGCQKAVIGVSGGLDSTLALLVIVKAFDLLSLDRKGILAVTMPCFGTTSRTFDNSCKLAKVLGSTLLKINIQKAVLQHFEDIGQSTETQDVTYENCQARERTQVLMDIANKEGALVIGTGDMSELALGWATYNGDHMSMYGVNGGVPKTLVRHLVRYYADTCNNTELTEVLNDVLDTPVSPELLPPMDGKISQKTEDIVGPYELHDFFLYYMLRAGFPPDKIFRIATDTFEEQFGSETILKWIRIFYKRFFSQQFKRSCLPDGPKVGSVAVSPRGDLRMPSDAVSTLWMEQLDRLE